MNCPFCNIPMREGYLQSVRNIIWSEKKKQVLMNVGKDDVKVSKGWVTGCFAEAAYCPKCGKIITEEAKD